MKMEIVAYQCTKPRHVRGTRIEPGTTLYAIKYNAHYFVWSYLHRGTAEAVAAKLTPPTDPTDLAANWRYYLLTLTPTALAPEKV